MGDTDLTERIRQCAHEIWESEGRPHGRDLVHWLRAEAEIFKRLKAPGPTEKPPKPTPKLLRKSAPSSKQSARSRQERTSKG